MKLEEDDSSLNLTQKVKNQNDSSPPQFDPQISFFKPKEKSHTHTLKNIHSAADFFPSLQKKSKKRKHPYLVELDTSHIHLDKHVLHTTHGDF